jgi:hypothetical protein
VKKYKIRDIPKGQRWGYFWSYYTLHVFCIVIAAAMLGYTAYLVFIKPHSDLSLMWLSDRYDPVCENVVKDKIEKEMDWDINGDGTVKVSISYMEFDTEYRQLDADTKTELAIIMSTGDNYIFLVNDYAMQWMLDNDLLGTWGDFGGCEGEDDNEIFAIEATDLHFFSEESFEALEGMRICIAQRPSEKTGLYDAQMSALRELRQYD